MKITIKIDCYRKNAPILVRYSIEVKNGRTIWGRKCYRLLSGYYRMRYRTVFQNNIFIVYSL